MKLCNKLSVSLYSLPYVLYKFILSVSLYCISGRETGPLHAATLTPGATPHAAAAPPIACDVVCSCGLV